MSLFTHSTDAKVDRIRTSWLSPTRRAARWLASVADEVASVPTAPSGTYLYVSLGATDPNGGVRGLLIPRSHMESAIERIPALAPWRQRVALGA